VAVCVACGPVRMRVMRNSKDPARARAGQTLTRAPMSPRDPGRGPGRGPGWRRWWRRCRRPGTSVPGVVRAVRDRLAPLVRSEIRTIRTASTAGKYSNGGRLGRRMCVRIGHLPPPGAAGRHRIPGAASTLVSLSPVQIALSSVP
jgi:hypothetical protein